ncbi:MAG TPA: lactonase family protein [Terracidiphilus sp.]|nr:lactonase family protein [Terracidiphilus sp.]
MGKLNRRDFLMTASAATLAAASPSFAASSRQRVFIGSNTPDGILAFDWNPANAELTAAGVAAKIPNVDWITFSPGREFLYAAAEVDSFNGKPTGEVASFRVEKGELHPLSAQNSAAPGTCHIALDHSGRVLLSADYGGGSAASFLITDGSLSPAVWSEHYTVHGPNKDRQQSAHAHFASFSPDNRYAYINDLGGDMIHIYSLNEATAMLTPAGTYHARPGAGCRTLHFHPNGHTAYCMNELDSTVDVLRWSRTDGSLTFLSRIALLPEGYNGPTRACDTVIAKDGRFVYFANRDNDFLYSFRADAKTGALTPIGRSNCGGKIPRNFVLDPTERWMLVANQDSNNVAVFARNPETGILAGQGKAFAVAAPMCILFA